MAEDIQRQDNQNQPELPTSNKRIAKNTLALYARMFIAMVVGLYTSRVVLSTLGVVDFGIYGLVGGVISMMGFLNASMSGATSRFITYELGLRNKERISKTFSNAMIVHILIAITVLIVAETVGLWFLESKLVIPDKRMTAARWVYQLSIASAMLGITQVPYNASIIAHEKMDVYAYVEILNVTLKLIIVYLLAIGNFDKLILYAWLHFGVSVIIIIIYRIYCIKKFEECHFKFVWDKSYIRPLLSFTGWDLYGNGCVTIRQQGTNFLINMFFGVVYNAASSVATTAQGVVTGLAANVVMAFRPQIIKNYAVGNIARMQELSCNALTYVVLLFGCMAIPFILDMPYIMRIWLGQVPDKAVIFCQILLLFMFFALANNVFIICIHSTGNIKRVSLITGTIHLLTLPAIYYLFLVGLSPEFAYIATLVAGIVVDISNLLIIKKQIPVIRIGNFVFNWLKSMCVLLIITIVPFIIHINLAPSFLRLVIETMFTIIPISIYVYLFLLNVGQREMINSKIKHILHIT